MSQGSDSILNVAGGMLPNKRANAEAILNEEQPEYYFDFMNAMSFVPDPVFLGDIAPMDGQELDASSP